MNHTQMTLYKKMLKNRVDGFPDKDYSFQVQRRGKRQQRQIVHYTLLNPKRLWSCISLTAYLTDCKIQLKCLNRLFLQCDSLFRSIERTVEKRKNIPEWLISDKVNNKPANMALRQLWHTTDGDILDFDSTGNMKKSSKWQSSYYGIKEECELIELQTKRDTVETTISIKA